MNQKYEEWPDPFPDKDNEEAATVGTDWMPTPEPGFQFLNMDQIAFSDHRNEIIAQIQEEQREHWQEQNRQWQQRRRRKDLEDGRIVFECHCGRTIASTIHDGGTIKLKIDMGGKTETKENSRDIPQYPRRLTDPRKVSIRSYSMNDPKMVYAYLRPSEWSICDTGGRCRQCGTSHYLIYDEIAQALGYADHNALCRDLCPDRLLEKENLLFGPRGWPQILELLIRPDGQKSLDTPRKKRGPTT